MKEREDDAMGMPVIELKNINKSFSGNKVLNNIDLTVYPGEILCMVGENGSGKSTIIKIISGVYECDEGTVIINGKPFSQLTPTQSIKEGIQVIYQDFSVFPNLTVAENISLSSQLLTNSMTVNWKQMKAMAKRALDALGVELDLDCQVGSLSVAQRQIVAISRAILQDARLIIMDEPTTALTQKEIDRLYDIIRGLSARGIAVIFVSHKLDEVFNICQRIMVIRNGEKVVDKMADDFEKEKLVYYMTGKDIQVTGFVYEKKSDQSMLKVENISLEHYFYNVSFELYPGEILAITGQLGSGRTELAKALFGIMPATGGTIYINQEKVEIKSIEDALRYRIAYVPEDRLTEGLFMSRPISDNIVATVIDRLVNYSGLLDDRKVEEEAGKWIKRLNINAKSLQAPAATFSGGNQQRIVLGKWLAAEPQLLILNCPTVGVDVKSKSEIHAAIKELATQGIGVLLISDDIGEILKTSNRVIVMNNGMMVYAGDTGRISHDELSKKITDAA